jgi:hypothetical protein
MERVVSPKTGPGSGAFPVAGSGGLSRAPKAGGTNFRFGIFLAMSLGLILYTFFAAISQTRKSNVLALSVLNEEAFMRAVPATCVIEGTDSLLKKMAKFPGSSLVYKDDASYLGVKFTEAENENPKVIVDCDCVASLSD